MSWLYRKAITISHTQNQDSVDLLNYPLLVSLSDPNLATTNFGGYVQYSNGSDITFTDSNNILLDFEIESYNNATGTLAAWVRIPTFSGTVDTTIYMYFDNAAITTSQANPTGVWDGNFSGVYHLGNGTTLSVADSTTNASNGSNNGVTASSGQIDGGGFFGAGGNYIDTPSRAAPNQFTLQAWVNVIDNGPRDVISQNNSTQTTFTYVLTFGTGRTSGFTVANVFKSVATGTITNNVWHQVALVYTGSALIYYLDGVQAASSAVSGTPDSLASHTMIGREGDAGLNFWFGNLDEVRLSTASNNAAAARSAGWIATEYANQNSPSTFYSVGPLQQPPTLLSPFWHRPRWIPRPLVNPVFNPTPSEPFPSWVDRAITANFVRPTTPVNIPGSVPRSLSATLVNYARNISTRFNLAITNQRIKDVATRLLLMSANQLKDIASRFNLAKLQDTTTRFNLAKLQDIASRFRLLGAATLKDIVARFRLSSAPPPPFSCTQSTKSYYICRGMSSTLVLPYAPCSFASTFYGSSVAQTLGGLTQAAQLSTTNSGIETSFTITAPAWQPAYVPRPFSADILQSPTTNQWIELTAQGGTAVGTYAIPAPTGLGWSVNMAGQTILPGYWAAWLQLSKSGTPITTGSLVLRAWHRTYDGQYLLIMKTFLGPTTFSTTKTLYQFASNIGQWWQFLANEVLYIDVFALNGAADWHSDVFTVYVSTSATQGVLNDLMIQGPAMIATPAGPSLITAGNTYESVLDQSISCTNTVTGRSTLVISSKDVSALYTHPYGTPILLSDALQGTIYNGWLDNNQKTKVGPGQPELQHNITGKDKHWLADKRANKTNYAGWFAGDVIADMIQQTLSNEGVWGDFAIESDYTQATFGQGALNGVTATNTVSPITYNPNVTVPPATTNTGDLELGQQTSSSRPTTTSFMLNEQTTSDFGTGTLNNMVAANNTLSPTTQSALRVIATVPVQGAQNVSFGGEQTTNSNGTAVVTIINSIGKATFWSGSQALGTNDHLNFDIWIQSSSPAFMAGVTLGFGDGTDLVTLAEATHPSGWTLAPYWDQNYMPTDPTTDLTNFAKDQWYTRTIDLSAANGKTVTSVSVFIAGNPAGTYTVYIKNCYLSSVPASPFLSTSATATQINPPTITTTGQYISTLIRTSVEQVYNPATSYRISPAHNIGNAGILQNSSITWTSANPITGPNVIACSPGAATVAGTTLLFVSYDGATWLPCSTLTCSPTTGALNPSSSTSQTSTTAPLPGLPTSANIAGLTFYLREQFQSGPDPTAIPSISQVAAMITSGVSGTVTDVNSSFGTAGQWNAGTEIATLPNSNGQLSTVSSQSQNWSGGIANQDFFSGNTGGGGTVTQGTSGGAYTITIPAQNSDNGANGIGYWGTSRLDAFGQPLDFIFDVDLSGPCYNFTPQFCGIPQNVLGVSQVGILYRTNNWDNTNNDWGYYLGFSALGLQLGHGSNLGSSQQFTQIYFYANTFSANTTYHLTLVVRGNRHTVFLNHGSTPVIDVIDSALPTAGFIGLRNFSTSFTANTSSCTPNTYINVDFAANIATFNNVALTDMNMPVGTWTSPAISLSTLGVCGNTQINWAELNSAGGTQSTTVVQASLDGGVTYQLCQRGGSIPGLASGTNVSGKSLIIQMILSQATTAGQAFIFGLYVRVCGPVFGTTGVIGPTGQVTIYGSRISPMTSLSSVLDLGATNVMYQGNTPTNTAIAVATSLNGIQWTPIGNNGAGYDISAAYGWTPRPAAYQDLFQAVSSSNYTMGFISGGSSATWTYNTGQSNITTTGGNGATFIYNNITASDIDMFTDMSQSDSGGLVWRHVDNNNWYECEIRDGSSSAATQNQILLYKVSSGVRSAALATTSITFTRGVYHRIRVKMRGGLICIYFDGVCVIAYLDTSPLGVGGVGFRTNGGTAVFYQLWAQPFGTNLSGQALWTRTTLSTTDPTKTPQMFVLLASVRGSSLATGQTISALHPVTTPFAALFSDELDSLTRMNGDYYWKIQNSGKLEFGPRLAQPGAFPLHSVDDPNDPSGQTSNKLKYTPAVRATTGNQLFRSQEVIINATKLQPAHTNTRLGDGSTTSWTVDYPIFSTPTITINNVPASVGVQGINTGYQFYWQPGSNTISYDPSLPVLPAGTVIAITFIGQAVASVITSNPSAIFALAQVEQTTTGIVEDVVDAQTLNSGGINSVTGMTTDQATTFSQGLLAHFGNVNAQSLDATVMRAGLQPGTVVSVFIPELGLWNVQLPITQVKISAWVSGANPNGVYYEFGISATNGPQINIWSDLWFGF